MKPKLIILLAVTFLILQATYKVWAVYMSFWGMFIFFGLAAIYLIFVVILLYQLFLIVRSRFKERDRIISSFVLATSLSIVALFPQGLIDKDWFRADDVLIAWQEGGGNCHTYLALKDDHTFVATTYCFGVSELTGTYTIKEDTVLFGEDSDREYAGGYAVLSKNDADTFAGILLHVDGLIDAYPMWVRLDRLSKK